MSQLLSCKLTYTLVGDYYIPNIALPEENRPIGRWGRLHRDYLEKHHPILFNDLVLSGQLWTYLADLNEQAQERLSLIIQQMKGYVTKEVGYSVWQKLFHDHIIRNEADYYKIWNSFCHTEYPTSFVT